MQLTLLPDLETLVKERLSSGEYADMEDARLKSKTPGKLD
jgi:hypothetical protein